MTQDGTQSAETDYIASLIKRNATILGCMVPCRPENGIQSVELNHAPVVDDSVEWDDMEADVTELTTLFSPLVDTLLSKSFFNLRITRIDDFGSFFKPLEANHAMDMTAGSGFVDQAVATHPSNIMITPLMISEYYKTALVNRFNEREFIPHPVTGEMRYNSSWWRASTYFRQPVSLYGQNIKYISFGGESDSIWLHPNQHASHRAGFNRMGGEFNGTIRTASGTPAVKVRLYNLYAHIFCSMMEAPIVATARHYHFRPVLLFKSVLFRRNKRENQFEIYSIDRGATTSIHMVGFYRKSKDGTKDQFLALTGEDNSLATMY